ncbi:hypothetical protein PHISP_01402 [Aspergillus sp. HF37]|nr:hypothetical protein PHISP_01402 [Aspergillus sp. HF37]
MHSHLWIRSPAVDGILRRAVDRYDKFLQLFTLYPGSDFVSALDLDLVWHTHQCSATQYRLSVVDTNRYLNHNDKLRTTIRNNGMERTKELFFIYFGQPYITCKCWDCEAVLSAVENNDEIGFQDVDGITRLANEVMDGMHDHRFVEIARRFAPDKYSRFLREGPRNAS